MGATISGIPDAILSIPHTCGNCPLMGLVAAAVLICEQSVKRCFDPSRTHLRRPFGLDNLHNRGLRQRDRR